MKTRIFISPLAPYIEGLFAQKISDGYIYEAEAATLEVFDRFFLNAGLISDVITREVFMAWAAQRPSENLATRTRRVTVVRQLALYMRAIGKDAYVSHDRFSTSKSVVHVLTAEELAAFFAVVDASINENRRDLHFSFGYRLLFRLYYCCGMRLAEGAYLAKDDINLASGCITITHSKGRKDRLVYMADDLIDLCGDYFHTLSKLITHTPWVFTGRDPQLPVLKHSICRKFRQFWMKTPYADTCDKRPTPHSLRHAFVVDKMNEWMLKGKDLKVMVPYLSAYLGHSSPDETFYYYHQVNKAFDVIKQKDIMSAHVIPEVTTYEEG